MTHDEVRRLPAGLYCLFWVGGGTSLASVGILYDGTHWFAPVNWTARKSDGIANDDWNMILRVEPVDVKSDDEEEDEPGPEAPVVMKSNSRRFDDLLDVRLPSGGYLVYRARDLEPALAKHLDEVRKETLLLVAQAIRRVPRHASVVGRDVAIWDTAMNAAADSILYCLDNQRSG